MNIPTDGIPHYKYPRTYHLPWSPGITSDDKMIKTTEHFVGQRVIVTEKMDGENFTLYPDHLHARSIDSGAHVSRAWIKRFHASICNDIPETFRICGENLYAQHSIEYNNLKSYFYGFSIWEGDRCIPWDETLEYFDIMGIAAVNILYDGIYDEVFIRNIKLSDNMEGYVVRLAKGFDYDEFHVSVAKFVRAEHVQTLSHWMFTECKPNKLR